MRVLAAKPSPDKPQILVALGVDKPFVAHIEDLEQRAVLFWNVEEVSFADDEAAARAAIRVLRSMADGLAEKYPRAVDQ